MYINPTNACKHQPAPQLPLPIWTDQIICCLFTSLAYSILHTTPTYKYLLPELISPRETSEKQCGNFLPDRFTSEYQDVYKRNKVRRAQQCDTLTEEGDKKPNNAVHSNKYTFKQNTKEQDYQICEFCSLVNTVCYTAN